MEHLIGHIIRALYVAPGEEQLAFVTDTATITYGTDADCCSETWFADVLGVNALLGATVTAVGYARLRSSTARARATPRRSSPTRPRS